MTPWNIIAQSGLMEVFLQNFIFLKTMLQILLKRENTGFGMYGGKGGESIHDESSQLKFTNGRMQPTSRGLESMLKEYYRCIHPESKQLNLKINFAEKGKQSCSPPRN